MSRQSESATSGLIAYFLFALGAIFIGPLEAVLGLAAYWFLRDNDAEATRRNSLGRAEDPGF